MAHVQIGPVTVGNDLPFVLIGGPCQIESEAHALEVAEELVGICAKLGIPLIYKSSFDKANRTSGGAERGIGLTKGLAILAEVRARFGCPVLTDVHQCAEVAESVDVLQIPAFLCRQTDLLIAAGETGAAINIKKGQFLAPWDMKHVAAKIASTGNERIMLTDRGTSFGYNTLVTDFRGLPEMARTGYPIVFDATHSVQQPGLGRGVCGDLHGDAPRPRPRAIGRAEHDPDRRNAGGSGQASGLRPAFEESGLGPILRRCWGRSGSRGCGRPKPRCRSVCPQRHSRT
jgi:2-dehydro-3-deoxyphosphooctonate aldolase (KDO 8-P synthase)